VDEPVWFIRPFSVIPELTFENVPVAPEINPGTVAR
jgi:hypothetical protein